MQAWQTCDLWSSDTTAMDQLHDFLRRRRAAPEPVEQERHRLFVAAEREALGHPLAGVDLDVPSIEVDGERYDRVLRCETPYKSAVGPVRVERRLYRSPQGGRALCPLDLRAGIIEGYWTPLAAKQAPWGVAHLTPQEGEERFGLRGNMPPSKSTRERLPKALPVPWEKQRPRVEAVLRAEAELPNEAVAIAVSLDGGMTPMHDHLRLIYPPAYDPDANRIEWLWRWSRREVTHNHQRTTFAALLEDIHAHFETLRQQPNLVLRQIGSPFADQRPVAQSLAYAA